MIKLKCVVPSGKKIIIESLNRYVVDGGVMYIRDEELQNRDVSQLINSGILVPEDSDLDLVMRKEDVVVSSQSFVCVIKSGHRYLSLDSVSMSVPNGARVSFTKSQLENEDILDAIGKGLLVGDSPKPSSRQPLVTEDTEKREKAPIKKKVPRLLDKKKVLIEADDDVVDDSVDASDDVFLDTETPSKTVVSDTRFLEASIAEVNTKKKSVELSDADKKDLLGAISGSVDVEKKAVKKKVASKAKSPAKKRGAKKVATKKASSNKSENKKVEEVSDEGIPTSRPVPKKEVKGIKKIEG